jgi:hypothetical protein
MSTLKICEILSKSSTKCFDISSVVGTRPERGDNSLSFRFFSHLTHCLSDIYKRVKHLVRWFDNDFLKIAIFQEISNQLFYVLLQYPHQYRLSKGQVGSIMLGLVVLENLFSYSPFL